MIYNKILESIYSLAGRFTKYDAWLKYQDLLKNQWLTQEELEKIQWQKLKAILAFSYNNIPFYKKKFDSAGIKPDDIHEPKDMPAIPVTTRKELTEINQSLNPNMYPKDLQWMTTSGTTEKPLKWPFDLASYNTKYALFLRAYSFTNWELGDSVHSLWWHGHSAYANNEPFQIIKKIIYTFAHQKILFPPITKDSTEIFENTAMSIYKKIKKNPPKIFETSTENLLFLSYFIEENNLEPLKIENIFAIGLLTKKQRQKISGWIHGETLNRYGPHEMEGIACECPYHTGLHVSIDGYFLECPENKFVLTDLDNFAQPLIRYEIGDSGSFSVKKCPCGRGLPLLNYIEGRTSDFIINSKGEKISPLSAAKFFDELPEIKFFQLIQISPLGFKLSIVKKKNVNIDINNLLKNLKNILGDSSQIEINFTNSIPAETSGKFRWVWKN